MRKRAQSIGALGRGVARPSLVEVARQNPYEPPQPFGLSRGLLWLRGAFTANVGLKVIAFMLALAVFFLVNTDREREITARVGVAYTLPEDKVLVSERLDEVRITLRGPWRRLRRFDLDEVERVNLDLRNVVSGELVLDKSLITVPAGITVVAISPRTIRIAFDKRVERRLDVAPAVIGQPAKGYALAHVNVEPKTVVARGPERVMRALKSIPTAEVSVDAKTETLQLRVDLLPPEGVEIVSGATVNLTARLEEQLTTKRLANVAVQAPAGVEPRRLELRHDKVDVILTGSMLDIEALLRDVRVEVRPSQADGQWHEVDVVLVTPAEGIGVKIIPPRLSVRLRRGSGAEASR